MKTIKVPRDQAWFWTPEWQEKEREADRDMKEGRYEDFENAEDLLKDFYGDEEVGSAEDYPNEKP